MGRLDQQQALYEFFGGNATSLSASVSAGATSFTTNAALPIGPAQIDLSASQSDYVNILSVTGTFPYTCEISSPLLLSHSAGAPVTTWSTAQPTTISGIQTLAKGEPIRRDIREMPFLFFTTPESDESRNRAFGGAAQVKIIVYTLSMILEQWVEGNNVNGANRGEQIINDYYSVLDAIADHIRTNKQLVTTNYPSGAAIEFGERFKMREKHEASETSLILRTQIDIQSVEAVNA